MRTIALTQAFLFRLFWLLIACYGLGQQKHKFREGASNGMPYLPKSGLEEAIELIFPTCGAYNVSREIVIRAGYSYRLHKKLFIPQSILR